MLTDLHIQNLAVVEDVELAFEKGLNVLTGSTGTGKSLILGAVNLLLGERTNPRVIRSGEKKAVVEGQFVLDHDMPDAFMVSGVTGEKLTLRREIHDNGRSVASINHKTCTLKQLQQIAQELIEPHGQNEQLQLKNPDSHVVYLDRLAGNEEERDVYDDALETYEAASKELKEFDRRVALIKEKQELLEHRLEEIERAKVTPDERAELEKSIGVLENANEIFEALNEATQSIHESETSALSAISHSQRRIEQLAKFDKRLGGIAKQLGNAELRLSDAVGDMQSYVSGLEFDPARLEGMQERLEFLVGLERRYQKPLADIIEESEEWKRELESVAFEDEARGKLFNHKKKALANLKEAAVALSRSRKAAAQHLDKQMTGEFEKLMMPGAIFRAGVSHEAEAGSELVVEKTPVRVGEDGIDRVEFFVKTNRGEKEGSVSEIASSGELSRIALALKKVVTQGWQGNVLVFDELDSGVGADYGEMIAEKLLGLAESYQIICITHMPQIAARSHRHLVVRKEDLKGRTATRVTVVDDDDRLHEIARMLGGKEGSAKRLALAEEMLQGKKTSVRP